MAAVDSALRGGGVAAGHKRVEADATRGSSSTAVVGETHTHRPPRCRHRSAVPFPLLRSVDACGNHGSEAFGLGAWEEGDLRVRPLATFAILLRKHSYYKCD